VQQFHGGAFCQSGFPVPRRGGAGRQRHIGGCDVVKLRRETVKTVINQDVNDSNPAFFSRSGTGIGKKTSLNDQNRLPGGFESGDMTIISINYDIAWRNAMRLAWAGFSNPGRRDSLILREW
jgi:hypothetical protein